MGGGHDGNCGSSPRPIVWDRMMVASLTLITSSREAGPLVAKESVACGTPVASVNVGDVARWLPEACIAADRSPIALADACERVLSTDWVNNPSCCLTGAGVQPWHGRGSICFTAPESDRSGGFIGFRTIVNA